MTRHENTSEMDVASAGIKTFYTDYHDCIAQKRYNSPYWLRRYAHRRTHEAFFDYLKPGQQVLDAGCGEGVLTCLAARRGVDIIGADISGPNVDGARRLATEWDVQPRFIQADADQLPFADSSFDVVLSSHVLEHLPDPKSGMRELFRVTRSLALVAMPTCLNPACWALLGGDRFWTLGRRSLVAVPFGLARTLAAWIRGEDGPDETYEGHDNLPHVWRFPHVMRQALEDAGFEIIGFEAGPLIVPYLAEYITPMRWLQPYLDRQRRRALLRNLGYGSLAVCRKL